MDTKSKEASGLDMAENDMSKARTSWQELNETLWLHEGK